MTSYIHNIRKVNAGIWEVNVRANYRCGYREWVYTWTDAQTMDKYFSPERGWKTAMKHIIKVSKWYGDSKYHRYQY